VTEDHSAVRLEMDSRPEAPALVRAALSGVAQSLELDSELFDDLKTAVSEACNNAVLYAYDGKPGPLLVELEIRPDGVDATIRDWGSGIQHVGPSDERMGVGLAVISALADSASFIRAPGGGTEVRMSFTRRGAPRRALSDGHDGDLADGVHDGDLADGVAAGGLADGVPVHLSGDVVVTVSPAELLAGVLGRVTRAVSARTHLSLDRFSDIYLVADTVAALAQSAAVNAAITFAVTGAHKRLELTVGPFRAANGSRLLEEGALRSPGGSPLAPVVDELAFEPVGDYELLRVVIQERREPRPR
jgi:serine/threonine-protein kinase RsbW